MSKTDWLRLKAALLVEGMNAESEALEGVGTEFKEQNHGSRLAGHRAPCADWYADVIRKAADIYVQSQVPSGTDNHCYRCDGNNLLHDALRERGIE